METKNELERIKEMETLYWPNMNIHESCLRAYNVVRLIREMINRWDSQETLLLVLDYLWYKND